MASNENINVIISGNSKPLMAEMKKAQFGLKSFKKTAMSIAGSMGVIFGGQMLLSGIGSAIGKIAEFEEQMDKVAAISRGTSKEVEALRTNALELGKTSRYTATEIAGMQEVMARLGKTSSEIIGTTKAVSKLSIATATELAPAAELMTKTMNAFHIETSEAGRVANVLAEATANSALNMEDLGIGLSYAGSSGRAFGWEVERVTAALGILQDNGIDASKAGTGLRKIFIELAKSGMTYDEAMQKIAKSTNKLKTAEELFGVQTANQAAILSENIGRLDEFTGSLSDANLEMDNMVKIMEDNLNNDLKLLSSAFDNLIQEGSALNEFFRAGVKIMTQWLQGNFTIAQMMDSAAEAAKKESEELKKLEQIQNTVNAAFASGNVEAYLKQLIEEGNREEEVRIIKGRLTEQLKEQAAAQQRVNDLLNARQEDKNILGSPEQLQGIIQTSTATDDLTAANDRLAESLKKISINSEGSIENIAKIKDIVIDLNEVVQNFANTGLQALAKDLGNALAGVGNFGDVMLSAVGSFMSELGAMFIALGIAKLEFDQWFAVPGGAAIAIAAGVALMAAGQAASASFSSTNFSGSGSSGDSSFNNDRFVGLEHSRDAQQITIGGRLIAEGNQLVAVLENQNKRSTKIGGRTSG